MHLHRRLTSGDRVSSQLFGMLQQDAQSKSVHSWLPV